MKVPTIPVAQVVLARLIDFDIRHVVISPGSRNAPLTLGLTSHSFFKTHSVVDERAAGFFALGMAQQLDKPVVLLCTSGSALLNYFPAIAEAFYSDIPLIVLSADRPSYRIDIGDGQTLRQDGVFERMLVDQVNLKQDVTHATEVILQSNRQNLIPAGADETDLDKLQESISRSNAEALLKVFHEGIKQSGPVHVNIPMEEPLYGYKEVSDFASRDTPEFPESKSDVSFIKSHQLWKNASSIIVLVGCASPNLVSEKVQDLLAQDNRVVVLTEITSNLNHPDFYGHIDRMIAPIENLENASALFKDLQPDLLVTFGGMVVSKKIKSFLRSFPPKNHIHIDTKKAYDTYYVGVDHIVSEPNVFFEDISPVKNSDDSYQLRWRNLSDRSVTFHNSFFRKASFSDFKVVGTLMQSIPKNYNIQWANSTPIRYAMLFPPPADTHSFCNRGTSGIEGSVSTAVGASTATDRPTLLVTGDLSFFYDANALWHTELPSTLRIIVINNGGGGIFRILPGEKNTDTFKRYFETRHNLSVKHLARQFGCSYSRVYSNFGLQWKLKSFFKSSRRPKIMEIHTPSDLNDGVLADYFKALDPLKNL